MRKLAKFLTLVLLLALVLNLAACKETEKPAAPESPSGAPAPAQDTTPVDLKDGIIGSWYTEKVLLKDLYGAMAEADMDSDTVEAQWIKLVYGQVAKMPVGIHVSFDKSGTFTMKIEERTVRAITEAGQALWPEMMAIERNMSLEELKAALADEGMTVDELIEEERSDLEEFTDFMMLANAFDGTEKMRYEVNGDKVTLVFSEAEPEEDPGFQPVLTVACTADTMTVTAADSKDADALFKGMVLTREN